VNFYDESSPEIVVPLDVTKTPAQNAQKYYREYSRLKSARDHLLRLIADGEKEISYLNSVLLSVENCESVKELFELRQELKDMGYLRSAKTDKKRQVDKIVSAPMHFVSSDGADIYVGKNNRQNDELTLKRAQKNFIFMHIKDAPGAHAVIFADLSNVSEKTLVEAAGIAAVYSSQKNSSKVIIDYTDIKNVKKPPGARPGMVIYDNYRSVVVEPSMELARQLRRG